MKVLIKYDVRGDCTHYHTIKLKGISYNVFNSCIDSLVKYINNTDVDSFLFYVDVKSMRDDSKKLHKM